MTKIKGKVKDLKELIQLIKLEGKDTDGSNTSMIDNCILNCKDNKISTRVLSKTNTVIAFIEYKKLDIITGGEIPIGSLDEFLSYLKRFDNDDEIYVEVTENKIKLSRDEPKKTANIPLTSRENIDDSLRAESIKDSLSAEKGKWKFRGTELVASIKVNSQFIREILDDGNVKGLNRKYPISIDKDVICKVGDEKGGMIETHILTENKKGKANSSFAGGIDNVFKNISGEVEIHLAEQGPMLIILNNDSVDAKFVVAPLIEED